MNELALFAGAGGGILGGHLLGWRTVCAVEWEAYPASVLCARQNDGLLPNFPIWDDVQTFDGKPWRGIIDVVSGGFPCQDISAAGRGGGLKEKDQECGKKWQGSFTKLDLNTRLWKTHQCSLLEDLESYSETWPQSGTMRNGKCWERQTLELGIKEIEFGLLPNGINFFHTPNTTGLDGGSNSRKALKKRMEQWPTPDANCGKRGTQPNWTPIRKSGQPAQYTINQAVRDRFPTPQASDNRDRGNMSSPSVKRRLKIGKQVSLSQSVSDNSGKLNPTWVEWLMGWPMQWTDLKPLEMDKYLYVQQLHGNY